MHPSISSRPAVGVPLSTALLLLVVMLASSEAQFAPSPTRPVVTHQIDDGQNQVTIDWSYDLANFPGTEFFLTAMVDGRQIGPFAVSVFPRLSTSGNNITLPIRIGALSGTVVVQIRAVTFVGDATSPPSLPIVVPPRPPFPIPGPPTGPPSTPILSRPSVSGDTVTLTWQYDGPPVTRFDIVAIIEATGEELVLPLNNPAQRTFSRGGVPPGNFIVSMRAVNNEGASPLTPIFVVPVGVNLGSGDLQVTLTWNSAADIDLHVVDPNGVHVFFANRSPSDSTARLDRDDTDGFGPENIHVPAGQGRVGNYRIYIVHFGRSVPTTARIQVTVNAGTPNERTSVFSRFSATADSSRSIEVAVADPTAGTIQVRNSLGEAMLEGEPQRETKVPEP
jgi:hypothetical protein